MDNGASSYRRFLNGDESAFESIMKELFHGLVFFIDRIVHDPYAAEDIAIDVFSELIVHKHRYNFKVTLKTYLYMLGRSRAIDYLRRQKHHIDLSEVQHIADQRADLEELVLVSQRKRLVNDAISKLPPDMQTVLHLIYFEEMTYEEAAKVMKKNRKQIDNLLYRAKKELHAIIGEDGVQIL